MSGFDGTLVGGVFLALAAWFLWGPDPVVLPDLSAPRIDRELISTKPRRTALRKPVILINGFERTCMECHRTFLNEEPRMTGRLQHTHIELHHGSHTSCYGCHDRDDRDRLRMLDDTTISFAESERLCAQCHQSLYADWRAGVHGRTNGYWNPALGPVDRRRCAECHDPHRPHSPAMDPIAPLPGPKTLRMGDPAHHDPRTPHVRDPLRRALLRFETNEGTGAGEAHPTNRTKERK